MIPFRSEVYFRVPELLLSQAPRISTNFLTTIELVIDWRTARIPRRKHNIDKLDLLRSVLVLQINRASHIKVIKTGPHFVTVNRADRVIGDRKIINHGVRYHINAVCSLDLASIL